MDERACRKTNVKQGGKTNENGVGGRGVKREERRAAVRVKQARRRRFSPRGEQRRKQRGEDGWRRRVDRERGGNGAAWCGVLRQIIEKSGEEEMNERTDEEGNE